jgi:hypothetical protein
MKELESLDYAKAGRPCYPTEPFAAALRAGRKTENITLASVSIRDIPAPQQPVHVQIYRVTFNFKSKRSVLVLSQ